MALFGRFSSIENIVARDNAFAEALAYARRCFEKSSSEHARILALPTGESHRVELERGAFAIEQAYMTRFRPESFFESHQLHIDVQIIVTGEELVDVADTALLAIDFPYNTERDFTKYHDYTGGSRLRLCAGDVAIFFPNDGHMPCLDPDAGKTLVRKTVVKVPTALLTR